MATASPVLLALLLFIAFAAAGAAETTTALDEVCGSLGGFYVTPELCTSALAARLAAQNVTAAKASIEAALSSRDAAAGAEVAKEGMRSCLQLYAGAVPALQWAARSVAARRYRGAREVLFAAQYVPAGCEGCMAGDVAALPRENSGFSYMATVAHAVVASTLRLIVSRLYLSTSL